MSGLNYNSDYGSGSSNSLSSMSPQDTWSSETNLHYTKRNQEQTSASFQDLVMGRCTLEDIMRDFEMNGFDSPHTPDDDKIWGNQTNNYLSGLGPSSTYLRQKSWPEPERTPIQSLPRAASDWVSSSLDFTPAEFVSSSTPIEEITQIPSHIPYSSDLTEEQFRVLNSLPNAVLFTLLQGLEQSRDGYKRVKRLSSECRFCKNNGERECYYRSHALKDGCGRVTCPVLRAFVCARCGASGDAAHTIKYCPLSTAAERQKSAAMLRSVRLASGRRRAVTSPAHVSRADHCAAPSCALTDPAQYSACPVIPLDPLWAALEQKLLL